MSAIRKLNRGLGMRLRPFGGCALIALAMAELAVPSAAQAIFWDGASVVPNGVVDGGSGTWNSVLTNWTDAAGTTNQVWPGTDAVFAGSAGIVTVVGNQIFNSLQFTTDGYALNGAGVLVATGGQTIDVVGGVATIDTRIGGVGSISQIGLGLLQLGGANTFAGGLGINQGTVSVGNNQAAGTGEIAINDGGVLAAGVSGIALANTIETTGGARINSGAGDFTLNGNISNVGSISQIGTGNLILNGDNSFSGGLGINQGTVTLGTATAAGTGVITINDLGILAVGADGLTVANQIESTGGGRIDSGPGTLTLTGFIGGAGSISQVGTGNLILNGNNGFLAGLGINQGTVTLGTSTAAGVGIITINDLAILAAGADNLVLANGIDTTGGGRIDTKAFTTTVNGPITGPGSISMVGTGNLILNGDSNFAGGLGINLGTVTLGSNTAAGTGVITINDLSILAAGTPGLVIANQIETTGGGRIDSGPGSFTVNGVVGGAGSISQIGTGNLVLNGANTFISGLGINQGTVTLGNDTAAGVGVITINDLGILAAGAEGLVVANTVETTGGGRVDTGAFTMTLDGPVTGLGSLSQVGTGNLILNGNNSFGAGLGINQGTVTLGTDTAAGTGVITINDLGVLAAGTDGVVIANNVETTGGGRIDSGPGVFTLDGQVTGTGSISQIGTGNLILNGDNSFAAGLGINKGTVTLGTATAAGTGVITINDLGILAVGADGLTVANQIETTGGGRIDSGPGTLTLTGFIGGAGSISQIGTGNLILNGNNGFLAGLGINQGTVTLGTSTAAGTGVITINDLAILAAGADNLVLANQVDTTGGGRIDTKAFTMTIDGPITGDGSISMVGTGNLILNGDSSFKAGLGINLGTVTLGSSTAAGTGFITINDLAILAAGADGLVLANSVDTTGGGRIDTKAFTMTIDGDIIGVGSLSQVGTGNLILNGNNSFAAGLGINQGTVTLGSDTAAGTGAITINDGATLAASGVGLVVANDIETTGAGTIDSGSDVFTLTGTIGNIGSITKTGSGTLVLTGTSGYTGDTTVAAGRLDVDGALTASAVTVATGGTLGGGGFVPSVIVQSGGSIAPGGSKTLSVVGNATFETGSNYTVTISGATSDKLAVGGVASLGTAGLTLAPGGSPALFGSTYQIVTAAGGVTGTFTPVVNNYSQAFKSTLVYSATDVKLTLNPASIVGLLGTGAGGSQNITNIAAAFDASVAAGFNPQSFFNIFLQNGAALGASLNQLTGEVTSANSRTAMADSRYIREAALDRLGATLGAGGGSIASTTTPGAHNVSVWARGIGSWTKSDADGNGSHLSIDAKGVITGVDASFGDWKAGALFNYIESDVDTRGLGSGKVKSTGGGAYAGYRGDSGIAFGIGGAASHVRSSEHRTVTFPGTSQPLTGRTSGTSYQVFGEVAYDLAAAANTRVEPFFRAAYVKYNVDGFSEAGGFAGLNVAKGKYDTTYLTGGVRGSVQVATSVWLKGSAAYQRTSGDRSPVSLVSLEGTTAQAAIRGTYLDKSAFAGELGIDGRLAPNVTLGAGYSGVIGKNTQDNGVKATLTVGF